MKELTNKILICFGIIMLCTLAACSSKEEKVIQDIAAMPDAKVGVLIGSMHVDLAKERYPDAEIQTFDSPTDLVYALRTHKVDAIIEMASIWNAQSKDIHDVAVLDDRWYVEQFGMIFNKNNTELLAQYNTFLTELKESGEWQKIVDKWFSSGGDADMPDLNNVPRTGKPLRVACTGTMAFYDFVKDGKNHGFDIEFIERFAAYTGRPVEYVMMNFGGLIAAVSSDVADVGTAGICITEERAKQVNFSDTYGEEASVLLIHKENSAAATQGGRKIITDIASMGNIPMGLIVGTTHVDYIKDEFPDAEQHAFDSPTDLLHALRTRKVDAAAFEGLTWKTIANEYPDLTIYSEKWRTEPFGMIFNKQNTELLAQYNAFLNELKLSGEWQQITDKWLNNNGEAEMPDLSNVPRTGKPLRVACTGTMAFFDFLKDGKNCGLDIEIVERFAAYLGRPIEFNMMNFGGLIAAISSEVAEIGTSSMCITEERAKQVNFGNSYAESYSSLLIRKENTAEGYTVTDTMGGKSFWSSIGERFYNNLIKENRWKLIAEGLWNTVIISILAILLGTLIGVGVCAMRMSSNAFLQGTAKGYIGLIRGIPVLVLLMILYYVVFASLGVSAVAVAILTFALNFAAYTSEMFRSGLESIDPGQRRAGIAMGFTGFQTFRYIILPQAVKRVLPVFKGESISLVKTTSIVGYIAVADLTKASDLIRSRTFDAFFPLIIITIIYFILAWLLGKALDAIGKSSNY